MFREVLTSFATLRCVVSPEGGVEECDAGTDAPGVVGAVVEVDAEAFRVGEDGLAGVGQAQGVVLPFAIALDVLKTDVQWAELLHGVLEALVLLQGVLGFVKVGVDVLLVPVEMGVVVEQGIEGLPSVCGEIGLVAQLAHGVDERGVALEVVRVGLRRFCEGDVLVPLIAEAAVARVGVLDLL